MTKSSMYILALFFHQREKFYNFFAFELFFMSRCHLNYIVNVDDIFFIVEFIFPFDIRV